jgi:hypothetical protein
MVRIPDPDPYKNVSDGTLPITEPRTANTILYRKTFISLYGSSTFFVLLPGLSSVLLGASSVLPPPGLPSALQLPSPLCKIKKVQKPELCKFCHFFLRFFSLPDLLLDNEKLPVG